jgi:hypothetical protein
LTKGIAQLLISHCVRFFARLEISLMKRLLVAVVLACVATNGFAQKKEKPGVYFVEPKSGATVEQEFKVVMGVRGMAVNPAGEIIPETGHHHLLIDTAPVKKGEIVPADVHHVHFGKGQTETTVKLPPGKHKLQLQFADGKHQSYGSAMSQAITVIVK